MAYYMNLITILFAFLVIGSYAQSIAPKCEKSADCSQATPVCSKTRTCQKCMLPLSAKCSMQTGIKTFKICNRVMSQIGNKSVRNCVPEFAKELLKASNSGFFKKCSCKCANRDIEGKLVEVVNQEACHLRFVVARSNNLGGVPICPQFQIGCTADTVCPPVFDVGVKYVDRDIRNCGPGATPIATPKPSPTGDDDDDDDDVERYDVTDDTVVFEKKSVMEDTEVYEEDETEDTDVF